MPLKYKGQKFLTFNGMVKAIKRDHPAWTIERCKKYAGRIRQIEEGLKKHG